MKMRMLVNSRNGDKIKNYVASAFVCALYNNAIMHGVISVRLHFIPSFSLKMTYYGRNILL